MFCCAILNIPGHTAKNFSLRCCFANTDAFVFCGSEDGRVFAWDLVEGKVVMKAAGHSKVVTAVAHHPKRYGSVLLHSVEVT